MGVIRNTMKVVFLICIILLLSGCSENNYTSEVLEDIAGISIPKKAKLLDKNNDCCSFNGDGSFSYVYEFPLEPNHKKCDYFGQYSNTSNQVPFFQKYLSNNAVCTFFKNIDGVYYNVIIQGNKVMIAWVVT